MSIKNLKNEIGITLIALIITIIVLLILAGVSIASLTGENGILGKANQAKEEHLIEQYKEEINLIITDEIAERRTQNKNELMIISLNTKIEKKKEEWVNEIYKCNSKGEEQENFDTSTHLLVESKEHYEFLIEVEEAKQTAKIVSFQKGTGEKYTVTYDPNGAEGEKESIEIRQGFTLTLKECEFIRDQYKFVGWCESQNGEGERFLGNSTYKPEGQVTLYAIWELNVATITFHSNDEANHTKQVTVTRGKNNKLPNNTFTKRAYEFLEWNTNPDGTGTKYEETANINIDQDMNLYVIWKPLVTPGKIVTGGNKEYIKNGIAIIPEGFTIVPGCDDIAEGLVISDNAEDTEVNSGSIIANGNQFVWIPVTNETAYERNRTYEDVKVSPTTYDDTNFLPEGITNEEETVKKANGFYIARYEAGREGNNTVVSKKGANVWNNISQEETKQQAKNFDVGNNKIKSALISGTQWDVTMAFIASKTRKDGLGNVYNVTIADSNRHTENTGLQKAGKNVADKVCNIYDLEGNAYEYIPERNNYFTAQPYMVRGGNYSEYCSASMRWGNGTGEGDERLFFPNGALCDRIKVRGIILLFFFIYSRIH